MLYEKNYIKFYKYKYNMFTSRLFSYLLVYSLNVATYKVVRE